MKWNDSEDGKARGLKAACSRKKMRDMIWHVRIGSCIHRGKIEIEIFRFSRCIKILNCYVPFHTWNCKRIYCEVHVMHPIVRIFLSSFFSFLLRLSYYVVSLVATRRMKVFQ